MVIDPLFWKGRRVFVTGHTGFKGSWLSLWLSKLGAEVTGISIDIPTEPSIYNIAGIDNVIHKCFFEDIRNANILTKTMQLARPEIVIHMAAQSLVRYSYSDPTYTYSTNVLGTVNVLEAVRNTSSVKAVFNITSDKCYENRNLLRGYREDDPLGGHDPYSNSKACAELVSSAYRKSYLQKAGVALATGRAGNVIGGGDWAKDRIVPDAINAFINNKTLMVRNPNAIRPWQHVLEPIYGYLMLCQQLVKNPNGYTGSWNFGPNNESIRTVCTVVDIIIRNWGADARWELCEGSHPHEAKTLKLDCSKANTFLKWMPLWPLERSLEETIKWYKAWYLKKNMYDFTLCQIEKYEQERASQ